MAVPEVLRSIVNELGTTGYCIADGLLSVIDLGAVRALGLENQAQGNLSSARTGMTRELVESRRGDSILWLDSDQRDEQLQPVLQLFESLRHELNRQLFLSLHEIEAHWAVYPAGAGYERHLDQFTTGEQHRFVSMVLYLNEAWEPADGGELRLHLDEKGADAGHVDVVPLGGRLVLFESARFWHEVLPANRQRLSITGWFRTRSPIF